MELYYEKQDDENNFTVFFIVFDHHQHEDFSIIIKHIKYIYSSSLLNCATVFLTDLYFVRLVHFSFTRSLIYISNTNLLLMLVNDEATKKNYRITSGESSLIPPAYKTSFVPCIIVTIVIIYSIHRVKMISEKENRMEMSAHRISWP